MPPLFSLRLIFFLSFIFEKGRKKEPKAGEECCELLTSAHDMDVVAMIDLQWSEPTWPLFGLSPIWTSKNGIPPERGM